MTAIETKTMRRKYGRKNERGFLTLDFIFAGVMAIGVTTVFFAVTVALSFVEIGQYVTYAVSRAYAGAHETPDEQVKLAKAKFDEVMATPVIRTIFNAGWATLKPGEPLVGDFNEDYSTLTAVGENEDNRIFVGAQTKIDTQVLRLRVPFLGPTTENTNVGKATLNSYLMREISTTECREQFTKSRYTKLLELSREYSQAGQNAKAHLITDNGC